MNPVEKQDAYHETGEVTHNIYIRKVEKVAGEPYSVEFATFEAVKDLRAAAK